MLTFSLILATSLFFGLRYMFLKRFHASILKSDLNLGLNLCEYTKFPNLNCKLVEGLEQGFSTGARGPLRGPRGILRGATSRDLHKEGIMCVMSQ